MPEKVAVKIPFADEPQFNCFVCGPRHEHGLKLKFFQVGQTVQSQWLARDDLSGVPGLLHGGIQATILDEIMWYTVFQFTKRFCLTQNMTIKYLGAVRTAETIQAIGQIKTRQKNSVQTQAKILQNNKILASAQGSYFLPNDKLLARSLGLAIDAIPQSIRDYLQ